MSDEQPFPTTLDESNSEILRLRKALHEANEESRRLRQGLHPDRNEAYNLGRDMERARCVDIATDAARKCANKADAAKTMKLTRRWARISLAIATVADKINRRDDAKSRR